MKPLFIILGTVSLTFGIIGILVPGIPTTPFLLLTAGLYVRSSERLYNSLLNNRYLGRYIHDYRRNKGLSYRTKLFSITIMWTMIFISAFVFIRDPFINTILCFAGVIGTLVMGFLIPTVKK
ncbi:MAG: YbaN family protein [Bacteroidales bacterium]|nr:MAG: YbaN family protein [Bacteroidales bacterium]